MASEYVTIRMENRNDTSQHDALGSGNDGHIEDNRCMYIR